MRIHSQITTLKARVFHPFFKDAYLVVSLRLLNYDADNNCKRKTTKYEVISG